MEKTITCRLCGEQQGSQYSQEMMMRIIEAKLCFNCLYWEEIGEGLMNQSEVAFVSLSHGQHRYFCIAPEHPRNPNEGDFHGSSRGFGGARFLFRHRLTGGLFATSNAWNGSEIPERWRNDPRFHPTFEYVPNTEENREAYLQWDSYPKYTGGDRTGW